MSIRKNLSSDLADLQDRLPSTQGKLYWRTLEELADTDAFQQLMRREFPEQASIWPDDLSRRRFLTLMGASLALAGLGGCSSRPAPSVDIVPYVRQPEALVPGRPLFYATAMTLGGVGVGLLAESHLGRPTKIEGNPGHPASLGATDIFHQASVLTLYDPDRSQTVTLLGQTSTWDAALGDLPTKGVLSLHQAAPGQSRRGAGLRILTETVVSPTLHQQIKDLLEAFPGARWHHYEPITPDAARRATKLAFGEPLNTYYDFRKADVVLALDADFFTWSRGNLRYVADFMSRRRVRTTMTNAAGAEMNRLYVVEPSVSITGAKADNRLALRAQDIEGFARALAGELGVITGSGGQNAPYARWVAEVAKDLRQKGRQGRSIVLAGQGQPEPVHLLAQVINQHLGNVGRTVFHTMPVEAEPAGQPGHLESLTQLKDDMAKGHVELLVMIGGNPAYTAPADLGFAELLQRVPLRAHLSLYQDETSRLCHWHLPEAHFLEAWSDTRAYDGTASIVQPLIQPLYQGRSAHELLSALTSRLPIPGREIVRSHWRKHWQGQGRSGNFEEFWQTALHDGVVAGTALPQKSVTVRDGWKDHVTQAGAPKAAGQSAGEYEIVFQPDPTVYDGRFANNGWLQECPKPVTKLTWDNAAIMSPATARELGVWFGSRAHGGEHGGYYMPVLELRLGERTVQAPAWIMPGHADRCVTVHLGYGRDYAGRVGGDVRHKVGFNAYLLRTARQPWFANGLVVSKTDKHHLLACTQQHHAMEGRELVRAASLKEYHETPTFAADKEKELERAETERGRKPLTLYENRPTGKHQWGMAIDLTTCIGCNACVVACQSENNIPVVGKEQVAAGREMHWLRIDRYFAGSFDDPREFHFQPVPCMHCEQAPCEYVCPVEATVHSADGLNEMVYNRCVGTRFCSNNCPYKVRRFNFLSYADFETDSRRLQYNPNVTVRSRGVMEKCSYCVQRIRKADIDAQKEGRPIRDGDVLTACQAVCPADAIVFGDIRDRQSKVMRCKESPLNYALLGDLNTRPRTTYLAALRNPNPALEL
jgi:molybdopterin-containing oxidoreductase family iron-sulfur binding subunit